MCLPLVCPQLGTWFTTQAYALTGTRTSDPLKASAQSTEPHKPGSISLLQRTYISIVLLTKINLNIFWIFSFMKKDEKHSVFILQQAVTEAARS